MRGTVYKKRLPSGTVVWQLQVDAGRDEHGKRIRISRSFPRKGDADDELNRLLERRKKEGLVVPSLKTFGELARLWLEDHVRPQCSRKTAERYAELLAYVLPALEHVKLSELDPLALERIYNRLHASGGKGGRPLSARTVKHIGETVRAALNKAVKWKRLPFNPVQGCDLPKGDEKEARILEDSALEFLLDAARGHHWLYALLVVASATGARRGELCALDWPSFDPVDGVLSIRASLEQTGEGLRLKPPKNGKPRPVPLPRIVIDVLGEHRQQQENFRRAFGADYRADLDLIFANEQGDYLKPASVTAKVCLLARKCGLQGIGLHSLRHTHGSQLIRQGVPLTVVSKRLGHSKVSVTADIYLHAFSEDELKAAEIWDEAMRETVLGKKAGPHPVAAHGRTSRVQ